MVVAYGSTTIAALAPEDSAEVCQPHAFMPYITPEAIEEILPEVDDGGGDDEEEEGAGELGDGLATGGDCEESLKQRRNQEEIYTALLSDLKRVNVIH